MKPGRSILRLLAALLLVPTSAFCAAGLGGSLVPNKFVTPNGDNRNDTFIFRCYNPKDLAWEAKVYDVSGREAGLMRLKQRSTDGVPPVPSASGVYYDLEWDPNSGGRAPGGIYIYQVQLGESVYKGTLIVIR